MILLYRGKSFISWRIRMATLSRISHAAWLKTTYDMRSEIRTASANKNDWADLTEDIIDLGVIEAWHKGGVRETFSLRDGHKKGTIIDVYDLPSLDEQTFGAMEWSMRKQVGDGYWFKGIFYARTNKFMENEPPQDKLGNIKKWFCSHIIEYKLRTYDHPTTDETIPPHGVWPGSLQRSVRTRYLGSIKI